ncbi:MAG: hypothetical protein LQ340_002706 [Diploschistes diacapsis]|nr:MAG: hypothetical protein LQ340_002706 [Diploschistes diacapsis]
MAYRPSLQRSQTDAHQSYPALPPTPSSFHKEWPGSRQSLERPSSKGSFMTTTSYKSRNPAMQFRRPTISGPSDFRKLEGAMEGTASSGLRNTETATPIKKPDAIVAPPFYPLESQIHTDGACSSPMPTFSRPPSGMPGLPPRSSSLPQVNLRRKPVSIPLPVRPSTQHEAQKKLVSPVVEEGVRKLRSAPMSKLEAEIYDLEDASETSEESEEDDEPDSPAEEEPVEKEAVMRTQSFYAHKGAPLLPLTLDELPLLPAEAFSALPPSPQAPLQVSQQQHLGRFPPSSVEIQEQEYVPQRRRSLITTPPLSPTASKSAQMPSLNASPVELGAKEDVLRVYAQRNAMQARIGNGQMRLPKSHSKGRRSPAPKSPISPNFDSRPRPNSAAKTFITATESKHNSSTSLASIASETSLSSFNSGTPTNEGTTGAQSMGFEILKPVAMKRTSTQSVNAPVPAFTLVDALPTPVPRALVRPSLTSSCSTEYFTGSVQTPRPTVKRSKTISEGPTLSPQLDQLGPMGWGQVVKANPRLITVRQKHPGKSEKEEWGKGLGAEWGVVY